MCVANVFTLTFTLHLTMKDLLRFTCGQSLLIKKISPRRIKVDGKRKKYWVLFEASQLYCCLRQSVFSPIGINIAKDYTTTWRKHFTVLQSSRSFTQFLGDTFISAFSHSRKQQPMCNSVRNIDQFFVCPNGRLVVIIVIFPSAMFT